MMTKLARYKPQHRRQRMRPPYEARNYHVFDVSLFPPYPDFLMFSLNLFLETGAHCLGCNGTPVLVSVVFFPPVSPRGMLLKRNISFVILRKTTGSCHLVKEKSYGRTAAGKSAFLIPTGSNREPPGTSGSSSGSKPRHRRRFEFLHKQWHADTKNIKLKEWMRRPRIKR